MSTSTRTASFGAKRLFVERPSFSIYFIELKSISLRLARRARLALTLHGREVASREESDVAVPGRLSKLDEASRVLFRHHDERISIRIHVELGEHDTLSAQV